MKIQSTIFLMGVLSLFLFNAASDGSTIFQYVNAQDLEYGDGNLYIVIFEENRISHIDPSTQAISAIMGTDLIEIEEQLLDELSLLPSKQLEELVSEIITNGTNGLPCNASVTTLDEEIVGIDCFSTENRFVWHVYPN
ncbi:MAG: hypothetical protein ACPKPY_08205 [Nitrososphaeraceae archaeon]